MASKRRLRRRSCEGKMRHASHGAAIAHAVGLGHKKQTYYQAYPCQFCGGWHIGRPNAKKRKAITQSKNSKW